MFTRLLFSTLLTFSLLSASAESKQLRFAGYDFTIKEGNGLGPGPNSWAASQVFVDSKGRLHLRFSKKKNRWLAGEVRSVSRLGFGTYEMEFEGDIGGQDKNVVFGFFNYPTADVGPDATNEIDVEFARWSDGRNKPLNYTVWPARLGPRNAHKTFSFPKGVTRSIHRFTWKRDRVFYVSVLLDEDGKALKRYSWLFSPKDYKNRIGSKPMSIFFNLWGFRGQSPSDDKPVEVIINKFTFTPAP
ncbi:MAG: hypothetical protein RLZZ444_4703 [Pseudomonadota bacterium]